MRRQEQNRAILVAAVAAAWLGCAVGICAVAAGCSIILPSHAALIDQHAGNAAAMSAKVQADDSLPGYIKRWWAAEADTWKSLSDWAHYRKPAPQATSQPASPGLGSLDLDGLVPPSLHGAVGPPRGRLEIPIQPRPWDGPPRENYTRRTGEDER